MRRYNHCPWSRIGDDLVWRDCGWPVRVPGLFCPTHAARLPIWPHDKEIDNAHTTRYNAALEVMHEKK